MSIQFQIAKTVPDQMLVFGWGNVAVRKNGQQVEDLQGDLIDPKELETAAYDHVLNFRTTGERHNPTLRQKGRLVESCVFTKEKQAAIGIPPTSIPEGWWVGYKIDDPDTWNKIKSGAYEMFSVEGRGERESVRKEFSVAKTYLACRRQLGYHIENSDMLAKSFYESLAEIQKFNAEGWSEYRNNPNPRPLAQEIGQEIERGKRNGNSLN